MAQIYIIWQILCFGTPNILLTKYCISFYVIYFYLRDSSFSSSVNCVIEKSLFFHTKKHLQSNLNFSFIEESSMAFLLNMLNTNRNLTFFPWKSLLCIEIISVRTLQNILCQWNILVNRIVCEGEKKTVYYVETEYPNKEIWFLKILENN